MIKLSFLHYRRRCSIGGYNNVINTDLSTVVIHQQKERFPDQKWKVLDALDMSEIPESSIPIVMDKSLIDTLLCCSNRWCID